jgi:hypothetical protein
MSNGISLIYRLLIFAFVLSLTSFQEIRAQSTILPTDIVPLAGPQERGMLSDNMQTALLNGLPSKFYLNATCETSFRLETNPFQMPTRYDLIQQATNGKPITSLSALQLEALGGQLSEVNASQQIYRILPNINTGWTFTPTTRAYFNYFALHDRPLQSTVLDSVVQSVGIGIQHDIPLGEKLNLQGDLQGRELFQSKQAAVFDYLPSVTLSYAHSPQTVAFMSSVLQLRSRIPFAAATREIDPFYSFGVTHRRGMWQFSSYATFVQNFRAIFGDRALLPVNNYTWVLDFEVARPLVRSIPSLQVFVRAEPVFNMRSEAKPGLSGTDFRLFYGIRMAFSKPSLLPTNQLLREQLNYMSKHKRSQRPSQPAPTNQQPAPTNQQTAPPENQPVTPPTSSDNQATPQSPPQESPPASSMVPNSQPTPLISTN